MNRRRYVQALGLGAIGSTAGCSADAETTASGRGTLTLAAGTTAHDSGLLDALNLAFEGTVESVPRRTAGALRTARDGDCDVVLVHARPLENEFLREGHGVNRRTVMVDDFLVVGPSDDPADAAGLAPPAAFRAIAESDATFLSRGDRSGTHVRERRIWSEAGIDPSGGWYRETGQGMGATLATATQVGAYTLADRGSFLTVRTDGTLVAHVDRGLDDPPPLLRNEYAAIPVNPARHDVNYRSAMAYLGYLTGPARSHIRSFRVAGERAFRPLGVSPDPAFRQYVPSDWP